MASRLEDTICAQDQTPEHYLKACSKLLRQTVVWQSTGRICYTEDTKSIEWFFFLGGSLKIKFVILF